MFTAEERAIFKYHNGQKEVFADPLSVQRKIASRLDDATNDVLTRFHKGEDIPPPAYHSAVDKLLTVVRSVFGMEPFDSNTGKGSLDGDCIKTWNEWCSFMDSKKKPTESTPSSSPSSAGPQGSP